MKPYRIRQLAVTSSTNDNARQAAEEGEAEGLVVWALKQTSGRGRHGRMWESPEGNLYCSVLLRPQAGPQSFGQYGFLTALALGDAVRALLPNAAITFKWPNDVLVNGKKISGILLEAGEGWLVVGMGLNVRHHPQETLYPATSLSSENAIQQELTVILDQLLECLWHWYGLMQAQGFEPLRAAWLQQAQKGRLSVRMPDGVVEGNFDSIDQQGHLQLILADGTERVIATGDVFFGPQD
ncbi:MAG: biotin--[acetyl-CoA-carboxylase] ligase [Alphaproteobacteria bacterium]|nr:biotin--[acetyl-CoA-carboxylase] ligase [Alphaproteobacteria bacterium]